MHQQKQVVWHWRAGASSLLNSMKVCFLILKFSSPWLSSQVSKTMWSRHTKLVLWDQKPRSTNGHILASPAFNNPFHGSPVDFHFCSGPAVFALSNFAGPNSSSGLRCSTRWKSVQQAGAETHHPRAAGTVCTMGVLRAIERNRWKPLQARWCTSTPPPTSPPPAHLVAVCLIQPAWIYH